MKKGLTFTANVLMSIALLLALVGTLQDYGRSDTPGQEVIHRLPDATRTSFTKAEIRMAGNEAHGERSSAPMFGAILAALIGYLVVTILAEKWGRRTLL
jgi:hypothetical protein